MHLLLVLQAADISIHAPREGSDGRPGRSRPSPGCDFYPRSPRGERPTIQPMDGFRARISIHAPREGSDCDTFRGHIAVAKFLSTLPARGATSSSSQISAPSKFLSTLPARGATRPSPRRWSGPNISIHAPREGSDHFVGHGILCAHDFYPRSPRGERRELQICSPFRNNHFYPRSPRGERRTRRCRPGWTTEFLSTLPARGATRPLRA